MDVNEVKERIETLYSLGGNYIVIYRLDDSYDWETAFKTAEQDFTPQEVEILVRKYIPKTEFEDCIEIETELFASDLCEANGYKLEIWESDQVFDSCGYDLFILSFAISNGPSNDWVFSFHNSYERC